MIYNVNHSFKPFYKELNFPNGGSSDDNYIYINSSWSQLPDLSFQTSDSQPTTSGKDLDAFIKIHTWYDTYTLSETTFIDSLEHYLYIFSGFGQPIRIQYNITKGSTVTIPMPTLPSDIDHSDLYGIVVNRQSANVKVPEIGSYSKAVLSRSSGQIYNNKVRYYLPSVMVNYVNYNLIIPTYTTSVDGFDIYTPNEQGKYLVAYRDEYRIPHKTILNENNLIYTFIPITDEFPFVIQRLS